MPTPRLAAGAHGRDIPPTAGLPLRWSDLLPGGPADLETSLAAWLGVDALQLECSGTSSLVVSLLTLARRSSRKTVVLPAYTCPLVALAVHHCGLRLKLCDLAPGHFDLDPDALEAACDGDTLAIVVTHLAGRVADTDAALRCAARCGAAVIEDAAQALGARRNGRSVGLDGDIGFFSLAAGKGLSIYEGGLLLARDPALRDELRATSARTVGRRPGWEARRSLELLAYALLYGPRGMRLAYGNPQRAALRAGDPVRAAGDDFPLDIPIHRVGRWRRGVGARAARRLPAFLDDARARARRRLERLQGLPGVRVMQDTAGGDGVWPFFMLLLPDAQSRRLALDRLWGAGLGVGPLFVHTLPDYDYLRPIVADAPVPHARDFAARTLSITNSHWLDDERFEVICASLAASLPSP
ncbi:nucleotide sugar aminotransferase [Pigmentiphaga sp. NML030171]|uniref:DegT/DnrJ/EryC1/StrS family aminotransferase n=1 Tax=unclassified Pigmentiphaga TaxID=2626614 RepID=UPI000B40B02B|nr:DegT/DnrJ/EryC1/StrS family aminotransferase [Pigmentiphaga sp. NML030171]OVZ65732.1 nucleotide sugar aminotransferase [Pigmentiphaga sp. NML030171]